MEITNKRYNELIEAERVLNFLYAAGADNWDGWDIAMEVFEEMKKINISLDVEETNNETIKNNF